MTTAVSGQPARDVGVHDFEDLVSAPVVDVSWIEGGCLQVTFDGALTDDQVAAVRRRICSASSSEETLRKQAEDFIAADPTTVTLAALVRVVQRLARLVLAMRAGRTN